MPSAPIPIRPASTVLLLRDGRAGLEVFMVRRHHEIDFASGALVFPGGKVAERDSDAALGGLVRGDGGLAANKRQFAVAAVREAFEEAGILLARENGADATLTAARLRQLEPWRRRLERDEAGIADFLKSERLRLALDLLQPFAHWITPAVLTKRFDTWFFLAPAPEDQIGRHDGSESVDSLWVPPLQAIAEADAGRHTIVFATRMNLAKLGRSRTVAEAFATARRSRIVTVEPKLDPTAAGGPVLRIPEEADYGVTEVPVSQIRG